MTKTLTSLILALILCFSLTSTALAVKIDSPFEEDQLPAYFLEGQEGKGPNWSYSYTPEGIDYLLLNGVKRWSIWLDRPIIIQLSAGSKNVIDLIEASSFDGKDITVAFSGTGELILDLSDPKWDTYTKNQSCFHGNFKKVHLNDGLTVTGGLKPEDRFPLTLSAPGSDDGKCDYVTPDGKFARYIRIAPSETSAAPGFTDVAASSPYAEAVQWAVEQKITAGKTATTFGPNDTCTVSHILTFLWRANGRPGDSGDERAAVTAWAESLGMDTGNLSAPCTRSAAVMYLWKAAGSPAAGQAAVFADVPAGSDYAGAVSWAVEKGITKGTGGDAFSPGGTCTRGQIVTFLYRASK